MNAPLLLTACIAAATLAFGFRNHRQLDAANTAYRQALQQAASRKNSPNLSEKPQRVRSLDRARSQRSNDPQILAAELIASMQGSDTPGNDRDRRQLMLDWQRRLSALKPSLLKEIIGEIETATGIGDETRRDLLHLLLQSLAENHPQTALELLSGNPPPLQGYRVADAVTLSLLRLMEMDPAAAIDWYRQHRSIVSGTDTDWEQVVTEDLLRGSSLIDPKVAFSLIKEFELSDAERSVGMIANATRTAAQRDAVLAAFREYLGTVSDPEQRGVLVREAVSALIMSARFEGLDRGLRWVETAGFTTDELEDHFSRSFPVLTSEETGKWLDWMVKNLSGKEATIQTIPQMVSDWAQGDYIAADKWLAATPEGPAKTAAAASYASALAPYHPDIAVRWLETLPPGNRPEHTIQSIHQAFLKSDSAAAAAFAAKYGIE